MKITLTVLALALSALPGMAQNQPAAKSVWQQDISKALALAKAENKLVMIDFYTDW